MNQERLVILNQDSGYLMIDLANRYHQEGYLVTLVTGRLVNRDKDLDFGVKWLKIIPYNRTSTFKRLTTWAIGALQMLLLVLFKLRNHKLLVVSNPPFAPMIPLFVKRKFDLLIYDIYPEVLYEMGIFSKKSLLVKLWEKVNTKIFKKAERIITISDGMQKVLQKYAGSKPIEVIPVWTDNSFLKPIAKADNPFLKRLSLQNKFIILYSGNLGKSHDVELIPELARIMSDPDIFFLIIGDGDKKKLVQSKITSYKLNNIILLPFQPASDLPNTLASADIAIVTLGKDASRLSVPSKTYNLMSVGVAILGIADPGSELASIIHKYNNGRCFDSGQLNEMKAFIEEMLSNNELLQQYKTNSLNASKSFSAENAKRFL